MAEDSKIVLFPGTQKRMEKEDAQTIDVETPVGTVYGVQKWVRSEIAGEIIFGTSLYSSAAKQAFVLRTLKEEQRARMQQWKESGQDPETKPENVSYRAINYQVY